MAVTIFVKKKQAIAVQDLLLLVVQFEVIIELLVLKAVMMEVVLVEMVAPLLAQ